jgi:hypothetical protein
MRERSTAEVAVSILLRVNWSALIGILFLLPFVLLAILKKS